MKKLLAICVATFALTACQSDDPKESLRTSGLDTVTDSMPKNLTKSPKQTETKCKNLSVFASCDVYFGDGQSLVQVNFRKGTAYLTLISIAPKTQEYNNFGSRDYIISSFKNEWHAIDRTLGGATDEELSFTASLK